MRSFLFLPLALVACASVNPLTVARLATLSPLDVDPAEIQVALRLPDGAGVAPGSAQLTLSAVTEDTPRRVSGDFTLTQSGQDITTFAIAPSDHARMRALQAEIRAMKAAGDTTGSLSVTLAPCRIGEGPGPDATVDALVRLGRDGPLLPVLKRATLSEIAAAGVPTALPPCRN